MINKIAHEHTIWQIYSCVNLYNLINIREPNNMHKGHITALFEILKIEMNLCRKGDTGLQYLSVLYVLTNHDRCMYMRTHALLYLYTYMYTYINVRPKGALKQAPKSI